MWTPTTREHYRRRTPRYQTDLTDAEWHVIEPLLPPAKGTGRPRAWPLREIVNAIFYVLRGKARPRPPLRHLIAPAAISGGAKPPRQGVPFGRR